MSALRLIFVALALVSSALAQDGPTAPSGSTALAEAGQIFKVWKAAHLEQREAALRARMLSAQLVRLRSVEGKGTDDPVVRDLMRQARAASAAAQEHQKRAAAAFVTAGRAVDAAIEADGELTDAHAWRAELFATLADSGRSVGTQVGGGAGLLSFELFEKGLESARLAREASPTDPVRTYLEARLRVVFHDFDGARALLAELVAAGRALPRDRLLLATTCLYLNDFAAGLKALDGLDPLTARTEGQELRRVLEHMAGLAATEAERRAAEAKADDLPRAEIVLESGTIVLELFEDDAPNTVANFIHLAERGFYDGLSFHRVLSTFVAQTGDPATRARGETQGAPAGPQLGGPGYRIRDEHGESARPHLRGTVAMARAGAPNTAGSQFFIAIVPLPYLDGESTVFGRVIEGLELADELRGGELVTRIKVLRKRDHEYVPETLKLAPADAEGGD